MYLFLISSECCQSKITVCNASTLVQHLLKPYCDWFQGHPHHRQMPVLCLWMLIPSLSNGSHLINPMVYLHILLLCITKKWMKMIRNGNWKKEMVGWLTEVKDGIPCVNFDSYTGFSRGYFVLLVFHQDSWTIGKHAWALMGPGSNNNSKKKSNNKLYTLTGCVDCITKDKLW